jgi:hypothetical protein
LSAILLVLVTAEFGLNGLPINNLHRHRPPAAPTAATATAAAAAAACSNKHQAPIFIFIPAILPSKLRASLRLSKSINFLGLNLSNFLYIF